MRITSSILASLAFIGLAAVPANAQQQAPQQQPQRPQVVTQFDNQTISSLLQDIRAAWDVERAADNALVYRARAEGDINFTLVQHNCSPEGVCTGMRLIAIFTGVNMTDPVRLDAFINNVNDMSPTIKLNRNPQGVIALQSYMNAAYGISYRNAQEQFLQFGEDIVTTSRALSELERGG